MPPLRYNHQARTCNPIDACDRCHQACSPTGMNHRLESDGKHVEPERFA